MKPRIAERMQRLGTESAFEVLARATQLAAEGRDIIHLEIGEPDFSTPANIVESAVAALHEGYTHYTPAVGIREVRESLARHLTQRSGVEVDPGTIVLIPGTKNIVHFTLLTCVEPGDEVLCPDPGYPAYASLIEFVGAKVVPVPLREERNFRLDVEELAGLITPRTRLLIVNSPQNPTGGVLEAEDVAAIAKLAEEHDLLVLSDEIYSRLVYDRPHVSLWAQPGMAERTILLDGMSKTYAMCGWRLGYAVLPKPLVGYFERLMINTSSCAAAFTQVAAIEAWESPDSEAAVERMVAQFKARRDLLVDGMNRLPGVRCARPQGAFYVFPNIEGTGMDDTVLARRLLDEAGVAVLSGSGFGAQGRGYIRLAYTRGEGDIEQALERMQAFLEATRKVMV